MAMKNFKSTVFSNGFKFLVSAFLFISDLFAPAQNVAINTTGDPAAASAVLDISSSSSGILIPRMTSLKRVCAQRRIRLIEVSYSWNPC